jgi:hypothetical protein
MHKPRLLITISFSFSIRYIVRTGLLQCLQSFAEPVIVLTWNERALIEELKEKGIEVHVLEEPEREQDYVDIRRKIDFWFDHFKLRGRYKKNQQNYLDQYLPFKNRFTRKLRKWFNVTGFYSPAYKIKIFEQEEKLLKSSTVYQNISKWVDGLKPDAVFTVTPFHRQEDLLLRVCSHKGLKMITAILSFDNITKRGWIPVYYDVYTVWNKENKEQLQKIYPFTRSKPVHITGAPQFDFYFKQGYLLSKEEWQNVVGIPANNNKKIILYAGGPQALFPQEPMYLQQLDKAITNGAIKDAIILFRCHPIDRIERWKDAVGNSSNIVFDASWTGNEKMGNVNITDADIMKLCSTLAYTDVHVNVCSTMTVDGSAFNKPQIGPAYLNTAKASHLLQQLYWQEHFVPVMQTKGLMLAKSEQELIMHVNKALSEPGLYTKANEAILKSIITYNNGKSTERVVGIIKHALIDD